MATATLINNIINRSCRLEYLPNKLYNYGDQVTYQYHIFKSIVNNNNSIPTDTRCWTRLI